MRRRSTLLAWARSLTLLAGVGVPCLAQGADLLPPPPPPPPLPEPVEFAGGWYLRVDGGWGDLELRRTEAIDVSKPPKPYHYVAHEDKVGSQFFVGGGVGYQFNPWLRFDATGEYRFQAKWHLVAEDKTYPNPPGGFNLTKGKFDSVVGLVNGYVELGTFHGITPFVGAGVGVAHHMFGSVTDHGFGTHGGYGYGPAKSKTSFAWAAHAGLAYALSHNVKFEVAYRYLNMGDADSGVVTCVPQCPDKTIYRAKDLQSHDVKVGLRYLLGAPAPLPPVDYPPPGPLVRKY